MVILSNQRIQGYYEPMKGAPTYLLIKPIKGPPVYDFLNLSKEGIPFHRYRSTWLTPFVTIINLTSKGPPLYTDVCCCLSPTSMLWVVQGDSFHNLTFQMIPTSLLYGAHSLLFRPLKMILLLLIAHSSLLSLLYPSHFRVPFGHCFGLCCYCFGSLMETLGIVVWAFMPLSSK